MVGEQRFADQAGGEMAALPELESSALGSYVEHDE